MQVVLGYPPQNIFHGLSKSCSPIQQKRFSVKRHTFSPELFLEKLLELQGCFQTK